MKKISRSEFLCTSAASVVGCGLMGGAQGAEGLRGPEIVKLGTIDVDVVETTPVAFKGKVYRFEYVRKRYWNNVTGDSYFRFVDHESGRNSPSFAHGYHLGSAMVDGDTVIVTGTNIWNGERVDVFVSKDMKQWEKRPGLIAPRFLRKFREVTGPSQMGAASAWVRALGLRAMTLGSMQQYWA